MTAVQLPPPGMANHAVGHRPILSPQPQSSSAHRAASHGSQLHSPPIPKSSSDCSMGSPHSSQQGRRTAASRVELAAAQRLLATSTAAEVDASRTQRRLPRRAGVDCAQSASSWPAGPHTTSVETISAGTSTAKGYDGKNGDARAVQARVPATAASATARPCRQDGDMETRRLHVPKKTRGLTREAFELSGYMRFSASANLLRSER